jgi:hypothetical protein
VERLGEGEGGRGRRGKGEGGEGDSWREGEGYLGYRACERLLARGRPGEQSETREQEGGEMREREGRREQERQGWRERVTSQDEGMMMSRSRTKREGEMARSVRAQGLRKKRKIYRAIHIRKEGPRVCLGPLCSHGERP